MATHQSAALSSYRPDLADTLMEFDLAMDREGMVGLRIAPVLEVDKVAGFFAKVSIHETLKTYTTNRAEGGGYNKATGKFSTDNYACEEHGLEEDIDDRKAVRLSSLVDSEALATERCRDAVMRNLNQRVIDLALTTLNGLSYETAAGTAWSTTSSALPIDNVRTVQNAIRDRGAPPPNTMVLDYKAWLSLIDNAQIIDRLKYAGFQNPNRGNITTSAVAQALDLDDIWVSRSMRNTANDLATEPTLTPQWTTTKAMLFYAYPGLDTAKPQFMRTFHWGADGSSIGRTIETYRNEAIRADVVRCRMDTDEKVLFAKCAQVITGVL